MFLKNYYKILSYLSMYAIGNFNPLNGNYVVTPNGVETGTTYLQSSAPYSFYKDLGSIRKSDSDGAGVVFGTGDTPPTIDDYKLSGSIITTITGSYNKSYKYKDGQMVYSFLYTLTNTGSEPVTIREVGWLAGIGGYSTYAYMNRTVLDTPVTIEAGGMGQVEYNIYVDIPQTNS